MPYASVAELPPGVKNALPSAAQSVFRRAFNAAEKSHPGYSEERLFRIAWGAVKNAGYKKVGEKWVKESLAVLLTLKSVSWANNVSYYCAEILKETLYKVGFDGLLDESLELHPPFIVTGVIEEAEYCTLQVIAMNEQLKQVQAESAEKVRTNLILVDPGE